MEWRVQWGLLGQLVASVPPVQLALRELLGRLALRVLRGYLDCQGQQD